MRELIPNFADKRQVSRLVIANEAECMASQYSR